MSEHDNDSIRTPSSVRLQRIRNQWLPVIVFVASGVGAALLLRQQIGVPSIVGEVEGVQVTISSPADGRLVPAQAGQPEMFDAVMAGHVVARLDRRPRREVFAVDHSDAGNPGMPSAPDAQDASDYLDLRAPIDGKVAAIFCHPGQWVREGDPIFTIATEEGRYVTAYVSEERDVRLAVGTPVEIRTRGGPNTVVCTYIERIGPEVVPVPGDQLRGLSAPERGLPVRVPIPPGAKLRPGQLVNLEIKPAPAEEG